MFSIMRMVFSAAFKYIWPVILNFLTTFSIDTLKGVYAIIIKVDALEKASGTEKRKLAFNRIKKYLTTQGKQVPSSLINLLIEVIVRKKKEENN